MEYSHLTSEQITQLESHGCTASDWNTVMVTPGFNPQACRNVRFSGDVRLGSFNHTFERPGGFTVVAGISDAAIHNCTIGDDVYIHRVGNYIANYDIAEKAMIENVERIYAEGPTSFGIGTEVSVLNETGGREVPIYEFMSAQTAFLDAMYRHNPQLTDAIGRLVKKHAEEMTSTRGFIGNHAKVVNAGTVRNVHIGEYAVVEGATRLNEGFIAGSKAAPVVVGANVMADNFILASGAKVEDSVVLLNSFVGQACHLTHLFSAHDSLFFANCVCENGEACAIFAGPYTVTMHK